jgi:nucleoside-diphosphate kinase
MKYMQPDEQRLQELRHERSLVIIKPDAVARHLVGEVLGRFERKGLKIAALKLLWPTDEIASDHYTVTEEWLESSGQRTYDGYVTRGIEPPMDARDLALNTRRKLMETLTAGPVVHVIEVVRKLRGTTNPLEAAVGTIGFDFSLESYEVSDAGDWAIKNIIHGSDSPDSAEREIGLWFTPEEIVSYETAITEVAYTKNWYPKNKKS